MISLLYCCCCFLVVVVVVVVFGGASSFHVIRVSALKEQHVKKNAARFKY